MFDERCPLYWISDLILSYGEHIVCQQLVWKASRELGVGTAISKKYGLITVARYRPRGNTGASEQYKKNVQPAGKA